MSNCMVRKYKSRTKPSNCRCPLWVRVVNTNTSSSKLVTLSSDEKIDVCTNYLHSCTKNHWDFGSF